MFLTLFAEVWCFIFSITVFLPCIITTGEVGEITNDTSTAEALFKRLYVLERNEQLAAIKALLKMEKPDRKRQMLEAIVTKVLYVIEGSKLILDYEKFIPGETPFPGDERIRDALSNVLENTAFIGDIIVRLPYMSRKVLRKKTEWVDLLQWSIAFTGQSKLIDKKTLKLLDMVNQEMNFTEPQPNYINPFNKEKNEDIVNEGLENKKKLRKKKNIPKGPRLSSRQMGEF